MFGAFVSYVIFHHWLLIFAFNPTCFLRNFHPFPLYKWAGGAGQNRILVIDGKFKVQFPTVDRGRSRGGKSQRRDEKKKKLAKKTNEERRCRCAKRSTLLDLKCSKRARRCGEKHISKWKRYPPPACLQHFWTCGRCKRFCTLPRVRKSLAGVGHLKRICKDACRTKGTCLSDMLGDQCADFLRNVAFWCIRSSGLLWWLCGTPVALRMPGHHFVAAGVIL